MTAYCVLPATSLSYRRSCPTPSSAGRSSWRFRAPCRSPPADGQPGVNPDRHGSWSSTPETAALTAARVLLARPEWRQAHGDWLHARLLSHLDSSRWIYRYLSTCAISLIYTQPDELLSQVESRLATENDDHVARALVRVLGRHLHARPGDVDQIFSRLAARRGSPYLVEPGGDRSQFRRTLADAVMQCLTTLAVRYGTPFAESTIRAWLSSRLDNATTATGIAGHLRGILNPADASLRDAQREAFELLTLTVEPLRDGLRRTCAGNQRANHRRRGRSGGVPRQRRV